LAFVTTFSSASHVLTVPHNPGSQPPGCWESQLWPRGLDRLPCRRRLRCSGSFAPHGSFPVTHVPVGYCGQHRRSCHSAESMTVTTTTSCRTSGKEVASPPPPPLRTGRAPFDAYGSSIGQRTLRHAVCPTKEHTSTLLRWSQQRNRRKPHQQEYCTPPTSALLPQVGLPNVSRRPTPEGSLPAFAVG
jgi:hypothetical protein